MGIRGHIFIKLLSIRFSTFSSFKQHKEAPEDNSSIDFHIHCCRYLQEDIESVDVVTIHVVPEDKANPCEWRGDLHSGPDDRSVACGSRG